MRSRRSSRSGVAPLRRSARLRSARSRKVALTVAIVLPIRASTSPRRAWTSWPAVRISRASSSAAPRRPTARPGSWGPFASAPAAVASAVSRAARPRPASPGAPNSRSWTWPWTPSRTSLRPTRPACSRTRAEQQLVDGAGGGKCARPGTAAVDDHGLLLRDLPRIALGVDVRDIVRSDRQRVLGDVEAAEGVGKHGAQGHRALLAAPVEGHGDDPRRPARRAGAEPPR